MSSRFFATACAMISLILPVAIAAPPNDGNAGTLITPKGICPLKHTEVKAKVTGPLARVTVTQEFENPFAEKIEAVYTFPLPADSAVDDMTMLVGDRTIRGQIKPREEARKIYEDARRAGQVAGLLDQERPNIFTQAVTNIMPGNKVKIVISYVETMPYEAGVYEFNFPMVVAPWYMPGHPTGRQGGGWAPDTTRVPDASRISPNVTPEGTRAGHDISVEVAIEAGVSIESLESNTHDVAVERPGADRALVRLKDKATIPNKDFIVKYRVAGKGVEDAVLTHKGPKGGFFTLLLEPPDRVTTAEVTPKELVFLLDTSGSMSGFPIEKAKETMKLAMDSLNPRDTFNLITFSGDTRILFPQPVPATPENIRAAQQFLQGRYGSGGTEMMRAIRAALAPTDAQDHMRIVCFMTDGEVGNDMDIISEVQKHPNSRVFAFGIGSSVNHFLLDNVARYGRGEVEYVGLKDDGSAAARRFHERIRNPLLTDISIDWGGLTVSDVLPGRIPDLFAAKPLVISGRYAAGGSGTIRLRGKMAGHDFSREIRVNLPGNQPDHDVLATLWARRQVAELMSQDFHGLQRGATSENLKAQITKLGMDYRLMTQFTSFVAVEEKTITEGGVPRRVDVPVEMPDGMSYQGVFGTELERDQAAPRAGRAMAGPGFVGGMGGGAMGGIMPGRQKMAGQQAAPPMNGPAQMQVQTETKSIPSPQPAGKLDPAIAALIQRVKSGGRPSVDDVKFVFGDQAFIRVTLTEATPAAIEQLRKAGLVVTRTEGNVITGRILVSSLEGLSQLLVVSHISPRL